MRFKLTLAAFIVCALASFAHAQQDFSKVEMKATQVAGNIWMLEGAGGNIGVSVGPDGLKLTRPCQRAGACWYGTGSGSDLSDS